MRIPKHLRNRHGATMVLVAILLTVLIGFAGLAVDIGYLYAARNELQNIADASALAAAGQLGVTYKPMTYEEQRAYVCDKSALLAVAQDVFSKNMAAGEAPTLSSSDILVGKWSTWKNLEPDARTDDLNQPDAVFVRARRDEVANGPIATFLARVLGIDTFSVTAQATAALTGKSTADPGELYVPVGISRYWFENNSCNDRIKFSPTNDPSSCAGWNTFSYDPPNDRKVRDILEEDPRYPSPEVQTGETHFEFIGGDLSNPTFDAMLDLYQKYGYDVDINGDPIPGPGGTPLNDATGHPSAVPLLDPSGVQLLYNNGVPRNKHVWPTYVVVYDWDDCSNPNTAIKVVGFARILMTDVYGPPDKTLEGIVTCDYVEPEDNRGGGGGYYLKGSVPGLVE